MACRCPRSLPDRRYTCSKHEVARCKSADNQESKGIKPVLFEVVSTNEVKNENKDETAYRDRLIQYLKVLSARNEPLLLKDSITQKYYTVNPRDYLKWIGVQMGTNS